MRKQYEKPTIEIDEFEIENILCSLLSGGSFLQQGIPIFGNPEDIL